MPLESIALTGLDGATPLGFLAGLGCLVVLTDGRHVSHRGSVRLAWKPEGRWCPVIHGVSDLDAVASAVLADAAEMAASPILRFRYPKLEKDKKSPTGQTVKLVGGLRPQVAVLRSWLEERLSAEDAPSLSFAAALISESASEAMDEKKVVPHEVFVDTGLPFDSSGSLVRTAMPTAFDFTSRNAQFLEQVEEIRGNLSREGLMRVLTDGTAEPGSSRTLDWDLAADAPGALFGLRARPSRPAAEWLAFRAFPLFPVQGKGASLRTTACRGRRKAGDFIWPIWEAPLERSVVGSLLKLPQIERMSAVERKLRGIAAIFRSGLVKKADGYTGTFSPPSPV